MQKQKSKEKREFVLLNISSVLFSFTRTRFFSVKNLKVRNPDKYNWDPKWLLSHLIDIYLHLDSPALEAALANDQRSFSMETFKVTFNSFL
jgi:hypothetical protein